MQKEKARDALLQTAENAEMKLEANQGRFVDALRLVIKSMRFFLNDEGLNWRGKVMSPWEMYDALWGPDVLIISHDVQRVRQALIASVLGLLYWLLKFPEAEVKANEALEILEAT